MRTSLKLIFAMLVLCIVGFAFVLHYLNMEFAENADYTEQDKREYDFYTPTLLKNMPRISNAYRFHYRNVSGPNPALVYQVAFSGTTDTRKIDAWLVKQGYIKNGICHTHSCWTGQNPDITLSIGIENTSNIVHVEMVDKASNP
ncbi:hypothetical protein [Enterobacter sp. Bisph1]|uniref:hypothetical protein n=1 Tax=Enterobacter sp. Bisph1 TaxID=1274399 RepID=UPI00057C0CDC|nr:hypothetical protein [Enterobacter sp. Bisph1]